jgi:gliding motility-associated-like protein
MCSTNLLKALVMVVFMVANVTTLAQFTNVTSSAIPGGLSGSLTVEVPWADYDRDGDLDFFLTVTKALMSNNNDGTFQAVASSDLLRTQHSAMAWNDYDNDGDLDLLIAGSGFNAGFLSQLLRNDNGIFTRMAAATVDLPLVAYGSVAWGDYDNDGDPDFVISGQTGAGRATQLWRNNAGIFSRVTPLAIPNLSFSDVSWVDYDSDGDLDFFISGLNESSNTISQLWRNNGDGSFSLTSVSLPAIWIGAVSWGDYDSNGFPDLLITGATSGVTRTTQIWKNNGNGTFSNATPSGLTPLDASDAAWADIDNDGDLDFMISGSAGGTDNRVVQLWQNNNNSFAEVTSSLAPGLLAASEGSISWGDYDNDNDLDLLYTGSTGSQSSVTEIWKNNITTPNTAPVAPSNLTLNYNAVAKEVTLNWNAASDAETPTAALTYHVRIGTTPGGNDILSASERYLAEIGNTGQGTFHKIKNLAPGAYYWSVSTVDNNYKSSSWAAEQVFNIPNEAPSFIISDNISISEDAGALVFNVWVIGIQPGPSNEQNQTTTLQITNDNNALFAVQPALTTTASVLTRNLVFTPELNAHGTTTVTVKLKDNGGTANGGVDESVQTFTITIAPINDAPSFTKGVDLVVNENSVNLVPAWATNISAGPKEGTQLLNFNVTNNNTAFFSVQPTIDASGNLTFTTADGALGPVIVSVQLKDNGGVANGGIDQSTIQTFSITINSKNDAPSFTKGGNVVINEDAPSQAIMAWASAISAGSPSEASQTLMFTLSNDAHQLFSTQPIIDLTGTLSFTPVPNTSGTATVTVTLKDNGGTANGGVDESTQTFTITVNPVNDAPSFTKGADVSAPEDGPLQTFTGWATHLSAGPADEATQALSFLVSNDNNALFSVQPSVNASGTLTFTPAPSAVGVATVTIRIRDNGGTQSGGIDQSPAETFTITINGVNDAPSFTKGADVVAHEDAGVQTLTNWATALSAGPSDESAQSISILVSNSMNGLFAVQPSLSPSGTLSFTPAPNISGTATVTVTLKDDGGKANGGVDESTQTFTITVNPVNDVPSFIKGTDVAVNEDEATVIAAWATAISAGPDESIQAVTFVCSNNNNSLFLAQPSVDPSGRLAFIPALNAFGIATVTIKVQDTGGVTNGGIDQSGVETFTITVNSVNDAPSIDAVSNVSVPLNSDPVLVTLRGIHTGASNEEGQQLILQAFSDNSLLLAEPQLSLLQNGSATLTLTPYPEMAGSSIITLKLKDDGGTARGGNDETTLTFIFTVEDAIHPVFLPNLFSPNGNGTNEMFRVRARGIAEIRFSIYDIYGQEVFSTTDVTQATQTGWDGRHNGKDQPAGTYTWTLSGKYTDGTSLTGGRNQYGQVVLIR